MKNFTRNVRLIGALTVALAVTLFTGCETANEPPTIASQPQPPAPSQPVSDINSGLIAHYPFDGNSDDASGNGRNGTLWNSPTFVAGPVSGTEAIHLAGQGEFGTSGQYVTIPSIDLSGFNAFTISLRADIQGNTSSDGGEYLIGLGRGHSDGSFTVGINYGPQDAALGFNAGTATVVAKVPYFNQWHRYSLVYSSGELTAYLDGQVLGTANGSMVSSAGNAGMGIHWWGFAPGVSTRFIGSLADVRIYNRALSPLEIAVLSTGPTK
jgi:hypothetical protein